MSLPLAERGAVDAARAGDDLVVSVGPHRRVLTLPSVLRRCDVVGGAFDGTELRVRFRPNPTLWPRFTSRPTRRAAPAAAVPMTEGAGDLGDETRKLLGAVQDWARRTMPAPPSGHPGPECQWCPLCQAASVLRGEHPELTERAVEAGAAVVGALRALVEATGAHAPAAGADEPTHLRGCSASGSTPTKLPTPVSDLAIGVDIGGTKIAGGVVDESGRVLDTERRDTPGSDVARTEAAIVDVVDTLAARHDVCAVGHRRGRLDRQ